MEGIISDNLVTIEGVISCSTHLFLAPCSISSRFHLFCFPSNPFYIQLNLWFYFLPFPLFVSLIQILFVFLEWLLLVHSVQCLFLQLYTLIDYLFVLLMLFLQLFEFWPFLLRICYNNILIHLSIQIDYKW